LDLTPVFDAILEKAHALCGVAHGTLTIRDGGRFCTVAMQGVPESFAALLRQPFSAAPGSGVDRLLQGERVVHIPDVPAAAAVDGRDDPIRHAAIEAGVRTLLFVPLRKDGTLLGHITAHREEARPFSDKQIKLLQNFAAQAVIAMENARLLTETREALEQQAATAEVLGVINSSPGDLKPVFDAILEKAHSLCGATHGALGVYDSNYYFRSVTARGYPEPLVERFRQGFAGLTNPVTRPLIDGARFVHIPDLAEIDHPIPQAVVKLGGFHTGLFLPLRKDGRLLGHISAARSEVRPFADKEIALLENFAAQAVIAMENARLLGELRGRTHDLQEALEYQTATSDVLNVISRSTADVQPVLDTVVETAAGLCGADTATIAIREGEVYRYVASTFSAAEPEYWDALRQRTVVPGRDSMASRVLLEGRVAHVPDIRADPDHARPEAVAVGVRTGLGVPLLREGAVLGTINLARKRVEPFTERQIELVRTFADQAVIAMENARLLTELQARTDELTRSVAELRALEEVLRAVNSSLDLDTVLATIISRAAQLSQADEGTIYEYDETEEVFVPKSAFGMSAERVAALRERRVRLGETHLGRAAVERAPVHVDDVQQDPTLSGPDSAGLLEGIHAVLAVPLLREDKVVGGLVIRRRTVGGFAPTIPTLLQTFAGQAVLAIENARLFQELMARGEEARRARTAAEAALADLRRAQDRLIQSEKMASLGQLTAGIAHEIKNPLNFVNNFAGLSVELLDELKETADPGIATLDEDTRAEIDETIQMLTGNLEKIAEHGRRADGIVKSMLEHSRGVSGERREVDLNALVEEALSLAYHGARAQDASFNITLERDLDPTVAPIELAPQEMTRVFLNLIGNGFYAATKRARGNGEAGYRPTLRVSTRDLGEGVEVRVRDNGTGIPREIRDQLFQPFFTTKPTGEGTGLGLSISWDIVTKQHGGTITVDSREGEFAEFTIRLPRNGQAAGSSA
jgi:GAF domain-containing protein